MGSNCRNLEEGEACTVQLSWEETKQSSSKWQLPGRPGDLQCLAGGQEAKLVGSFFSAPEISPFRTMASAHQPARAAHWRTLALAWHPAARPFHMCLCPQGPGIKGQMARVCERRWGASVLSLHEYLSPPCVRSSSQRLLECLSASPSCAAAGSAIDPVKRGILPPLPFPLRNSEGDEYFPLGSAIGLSEGLGVCVCVWGCCCPGVTLLFMVLGPLWG